MSSMAKQKQTPQGGFWSELFQFGLYKPNQGRVVRQVTSVAIAVLVCLAVYELQRMRLFSEMFDGSRYVFILTFGIVGFWFAYRVVNYTRFADFLIAVEAEMNKVSWPTKQELRRASCVVIFVIFSMAALLWIFDIIWTIVFQVLGIRYSSVNLWTWMTQWWRG